MKHVVFNGIVGLLVFLIGVLLRYSRYEKAMISTLVLVVGGLLLLLSVLGLISIYGERKMRKTFPDKMGFIR